MRHVPDHERRLRLARRHGLAPGHRLPDVESATRAMTVLHATEAASVPLAVAARVDGVTPDDVDHALHGSRTVVRQLAMRRTLFAVPRELLPAVWGSAAARTAGAERRLLLGAAQGAGLTDDPSAWWEEISRSVLQRVGEVGHVAANELAGLDPAFGGRVRFGSGKWAREVSLAPRLLLVLGAEGRLVRADNRGHWRVNRPAWGVTEQVLGPPREVWDAADGYRELVRRWLLTFGPGTEADVVWWLGSTKTAVRRALADLGAVQVSLDSGDLGWVLPEDVDPPEAGDEPGWAALLPELDPTLMGWKQRDFYLDRADVPHLFDTSGNGTATAWWNGRVVGSWVQGDDGEVEVLVRPQHAATLGPEGRAALDAEAERLTQWLDGVRVPSVYRTRLLKSEKLP